TLAWLDDALREAGDDIPALVCFHDPPVTLALPCVDGIRPAGEHRLAEVLDDEHRLTTHYRVVTG
ncbi:MAG: 3,5-cyclic-AMP phosphodiesterase, partial [Nocardioidaceae bacterium]|nr:3,5-cyclic-AMP phosphodiesterase [Nocardioidaceae bacterium]